MEEIIGKIVEDWFLSEPALFATYCTHTLEENSRMSVPMRSGKMRIEYNPEILKEWAPQMIEERLKFEVIRILLAHPYQRQPYKATKAALGMASDVTLSTLYKRPTSITIPSGLKFDRGLCFEEYYNIVKAYLEQPAQQMQSHQYEMKGQALDGGGGASDDPAPKLNDDTHSEIDDSDDIESQIAREQAETAELWEEDQLMQEAVKDVIERARRTHQWGSLSGHLSDMIEASTIVRIDYRRILSWFRASILSSKRKLTRMIPSRRYGFEYMGSKRDFCTKLLVAVDVSGSVDNKQVSQALSIINRFFKYGVENVDVIMFDCGLVGEPMSMKKAPRTLKIGGRGGTEFQAPIDYFAKGQYDGLVMITDGYAEVPTLPENTKGRILWMIYNDELFRKGDSQTLNEYLTWIASFPRSKYVILPPV
ncbi:MAG: VWA-like domain-containing protein [Bacteroidales bacterium]|nr:VWA-like domain-containing protein [Bacteroidales bacterium]